MKYMGSKRDMLKNGLGELLREQSHGCRRFVDLFCGGGSVSWFWAEHFRTPVLSSDLQLYAVMMAESVVSRTRALSVETVHGDWLAQVPADREAYCVWRAAQELDARSFNTVTWSRRARDLCACHADGAGPIWRAYGGHYFSPTQALTFDAMLDALPVEREARAVCLASTAVAASKCAASPGHTAQPFKATKTAGRFLREAWLRDPIHYARRALEDICPRRAAQRGQCQVGDANCIATDLHRDDLVFLDPPYSDVHYSRFYHVLETIARGGCGDVEGVGRYPPQSERPASRYSRKTEAADAMAELLTTLATTGCRGVVTFPAGPCSNGLSGSMLEDMARGLFSVERSVVMSRFSTLGGNNSHRKARSVSEEMILLLGRR